jgi:hypothetical protein
MLRRWMRQPITWVVVAALVIAGGVGLALFQPWKLWVDQTVNEAAPSIAASSAAPSPTAADTSSPAPTGPLATGTFITHEHETTGTLSILDVGDGRRVLRIENLDTSNGPDLRVWITDAEVKEGKAAWGVFDDGKYTDLGALKGNKGSQNYDIPSSVNLDDLRSISIWCARFKVSFGAAALVPRA